MKALKELINKAKKRLLKMHFESGVGHIGGNLSSLDLMMCLYHQVLGEEDAFVLLKSHADDSPVSISAGNLAVIGYKK